MELITISDADYHKLPHLSASKIKLLLDSPREFKEKTWGKPSHAMRLGTLVHLGLLEPEKLTEEFVTVVDAKSEKTKKFDEAEADNPDTLTIRRPDYDEGLRIVTAAQEKEEIMELLRDGYAEKAIVGELPGIGPVKCKIDWLKKNGQIVDIKTAAVRNGVITPHKCILDYNYHIQDAFYRMMCKEIGLGDVDFTFIFLFKNAPVYDRLICSLDSDFQKYADWELNKLLDVFKECRDTDTWGGKFSSENIKIELPRYLK